MGSFFRSKYGLDTEQGFVQGAGRVLIAPAAAIAAAWPTGMEDLLTLTAGATQYDPIAPWDDVGFTKTGINITRNNTEENYDVDQIRADLRRNPTNWEMTIGTQLEESTLETYQLAWELGPISSVTKTTPQLNERHVGMGSPITFTERAVAVVFQFPDATLRAWVFRRCIRAAQESGMTLNKTGEQVSLPQRWNALVDASTTVVADNAFGEIFEQVPAP